MTEPRRAEFKVPPEVPRYFADRGLKPAFSWLDVWGEEHAQAFTVAKAVDVELLGVFRDSIRKAIDAGQGFETWRQNLRPELDRIGWGKPRIVADPTGERPDRKVDFTAPARLQTIFSANMRSARAAGQWERIQRTKDALPYLLYVRTTSKEPRAQHLTWGRDDLGRRRSVVAHALPTERLALQMRRAPGLPLRARGEAREGTDTATSAPPLDERPFVNRRTGEVVRVPDGIDPGWGHNPGLIAERQRMAADAFASRIDAVAAGPDPFAIRDGLKRATTEFVRSEPFGRQVAEALVRGARREQAAAAVASGGASEAAQAVSAAKAAPWTNVNTPIAVLPRRLDAVRGAGLERAPVTVTVDDAAIGTARTAGPTTPADWSKVQTVLDTGSVQTTVDDPSRLWAVSRVDGEDWSAELARIGGAWRTVSLDRLTKREATAARRVPDGRALIVAEGVDPE